MTKSKVKAIIAIIFYILVSFVISDLLVSKIIANKLTDASANTKYLVSALYNLIVYIILFIPLVILYRFEIKIDFFEMKRKEIKISSIALCFVIFYLLNIFAGLLSKAIYDDTSVNQLTLEALVKHSNINALICFFAICIFGPIVEELVFRKAIFNLVGNTYASIIVSSILFASIHLFSSSGSVTYFIAIGLPYLSAGIGLGYAYIKNNRNIMAPIIIHILSNLISFLFILF